MSGEALGSVPDPASPTGSSGNMLKDTLKSIDWRGWLYWSGDKCKEWIKDHPISATLLSIELVTLTYGVTKKLLKSFIWKNTILEITLNGDYSLKDKDPIDEFLKFGDKTMEYLNIIRTIRIASKDSRVVGILLRIENPIMGIAQTEELRNELLSFRRVSNKKVIAYADYIGAGDRIALRHYYLASAADRVYCAPIGVVMVGALTVDYPFAKGTLNKLGLDIEVRRRSKYKTAANMFANEEFDTYHRQQYTNLINRLETNFIAEVAKARHLKQTSEIPTDVINTAKWALDEIVGRHKDILRYNVKSQSDEDVATLIHSFSCNHDESQMSLVLEFDHIRDNRKVYYQAIIHFPNKMKNELDRNQAEEKSAIIEDESGISISAHDLNPSQRELSFTILDQFKPGAQQIIIQSPKDIIMPPELSEMDSKRQIDKVGSITMEVSRNVTDIMRNGPYETDEAVALGLLDGARHLDEIYDEIWPRLLAIEQKKLSFLYFHRYWQRVANHKYRKNIGKSVKWFGGENKIGYIKVSGTIVDGEGESDQSGSTKLCRQLRAATKDKKMKGLIMHIDSPGGSVFACANIRRAMLKFREETGKPLIAVQLNVAASGGYYLSAPCDWIIAQPSTVTGSIGIITAKFATRHFWKDKLGINYDRVSTNADNASVWSHLDGYTNFERERTEKFLTHCYDEFKRVVAEPRKLTMEALEEVAQGNVWTGAEALQYGLVDEIGGIYAGIRKMNELLSLPLNTELKLVNPLGKTSLWDLISGESPENENDFSKPRKSIVWQCLRKSNTLSLLSSALLPILVSHTYVKRVATQAPMFKSMDLRSVLSNAVAKELSVCGYDCMSHSGLPMMYAPVSAYFNRYFRGECQPSL